LRRVIKYAEDVDRSKTLGSCRIDIVSGFGVVSSSRFGRFGKRASAQLPALCSFLQQHRLTSGHYASTSFDIPWLLSGHTFAQVSFPLFSHFFRPGAAAGFFNFKIVF